MKEADKRNLVIAQIETEKGLEAVEEIAAVEGIDCLWLGHFDLTNFLGIPGQFDNPIYTRRFKRIVAAGRKHGKALGFMAASAGLAKQYRNCRLQCHCDRYRPGASDVRCPHHFAGRRTGLSLIGQSPFTAAIASLPDGATRSQNGYPDPVAAYCRRC